MSVYPWAELESLDVFRRGPGPFETHASGGPSILGACRNLPDLEAELDRHCDDGTGYCAAGCNKRGFQYPAGTCPVAERATAERRKLLAERAHAAD